MQVLGDVHQLAESMRREDDPVTQLRDAIRDGLADLAAVTRSELSELAVSIDASMRLVGVALPQLLGAVDTVEELEESVETLADTFQPLQATAEKVGRVTERFSRKDGRRGS